MEVIDFLEVSQEHKKATPCSDFDSECIDVKSPSSCWCGGAGITRDGVPVETDIADGYCPLMYK